jgi:hypothetical protein
MFEIAKHCPALVSLNLDGNRKISDLGLAQIVNSCLNIKSLALAFCINITEKSISELKRCKQLKAFEFGHYEYKHESIPDISDLAENLQLEEMRLFFKSPKFSEKNLNLLISKSRSMRILSLATSSGTYYYDSSTIVSLVSYCPNFQFIACCTSNDLDMKAILQLSALESLQLAGIPSEEWIGQMSTFKKMNSLSLVMNFKKLTSEEINQIPKMFDSIPNLEELVIENAQGIHEIIRGLSKLPFLKKLHIFKEYGAPLLESEIKLIAEQAPKLQELTISGENIKKETILHLIENCSQLETLQLSGSFSIFESLADAEKTFPNLETLILHLVHLSGSKLTNLLDKFINKCPRLKFLKGDYEIQKLHEKYGDRFFF